MGNLFFGSLARRRILISIIVVYFIAVFFQLFRMQLLNYDKFKHKSEENSIKKITVEAPRGVIYDRNSNVLVSNKPQFTVRITPAYYNKENNTLIETVLGTEQGYINSILNKNKKYSKFLPLKIKKGVDFKFVSWLEENSDKLSGIDYIVETIRDYSFGVKGSHIFGYSTEINSRQLKKNESSYEMGDLIGATGLEKNYERYFRGEKGSNLVLVNSRRKTVGKYANGNFDRMPEKGADLLLTIDKNTQKLAEELMKDYKGAIVAIEPSSGEILALVSAPEYNLQSLANVTSSKNWVNLIKDEAKPMFNRATLSINSPGSTIKPLESLIALEEGIINKKTRINCPGGYQFGNRFFKCHGGPHGRINVETAIEKSCNTFFYQLILDIGLERWHDYLRKFGFGNKLGIDIPEETRGIVPNSDYYNRVYGKRKWTKGNLINLGIGQGELSVTILQLANYTSLLANYGKSYVPHFAKGFVDPESHQINYFSYDEQNVGISKKSFDIVREGMLKVVEGDGTAKWIRLPNIKIAGKTGTAQNSHGEDNSIFIGFAPYDNPKIAIAVMVENVGFGSTYAAPIAQKIIKKYLSQEEGQSIANRL